jgi:glycosyltransferase involved in cell wall biosynthesis
MHVLQVVEPGKDGVFRHVEGLCDFLLTRGDVRVSLAYSDLRSSDRLPVLVERVRASGSSSINLQVGNMPQFADFRAYFRLLRLCWRERPDIIHAHSSKAGALARLLRFGGVRVPIIYTPNAYFGMGTRKTALAELFDLAERLLSKIGYTINVSADEAAFARTRIGVSSRRQLLIYNAIDTQAFHQPSDQEITRARTQFALPENALVLGCIARDSFQKNLHLLYRAAAKVMARREDVWLLHVGEGDLSALTDELGLAARVIRVNYLSDARPFFHAIDAFAMPSRYEGLSFAIIEALGSDRPIIITEVPGNREFLALGLSHVWSAPNEDLPGFAEAIQSCLDDLPAKRPCNHQKVANTLFSYEACYGAIYRTYQRLDAAHKNHSLIRTREGRSAPRDVPEFAGEETRKPLAKILSGTRPFPTRRESVVNISTLQVVEPGEGGVFRHVEGLVHFLLSRGVRVHLAYSDRRGSRGLLALIDQVQRAGGSVLNLHVTNVPEFRDTLATWKLGRFIRELQPDVIHAHSSKAGVLARVAKIVSPRSAVLYTPHAYYGMSRERHFKRVIYNWVETVLARVGDTINISADEASFGRHTHRIPDGRQRIIPNPVDTSRFQPPTPAQRKVARARLSLTDHHQVVGLVARTCWQKDPETAYLALAQAARRHPNLRFVHVAWGEWKDYLLSLARENGLADRIQILDYQEEPTAFYHAIDALMVSSRYEAGWPFVVLEAFACNLPVIATTCPGMSDLGQAGLSHVYLFAPEDRAGGAKAIETWLARRKSTGLACNHRSHAIEYFGVDACFGAVLDLYRAKVAAAATDRVPKLDQAGQLG